MHGHRCEGHSCLSRLSLPSWGERVLRPEGGSLVRGAQTSVCKEFAICLRTRRRKWGICRKAPTVSGEQINTEDNAEVLDENYMGWSCGLRCHRNGGLFP